MTAASSSAVTWYKRFPSWHLSWWHCWCSLLEHSCPSPTPLFLQILPKKSVLFEPLSDKTKFVEMNIFALKEDVVFNKLSLKNVYVELSHSDRVSVSPSCASWSRRCYCDIVKTLGCTSSGTDIALLLSSLQWLYLIREPALVLENLARGTWLWSVRRTGRRGSWS